jgi:hypothetical protein
MAAFITSQTEYVCTYLPLPAACQNPCLSVPTPIGSYRITSGSCSLQKLSKEEKKFFFKKKKKKKKKRKKERNKERKRKEKWENLQVSNYT